MALPCVRRRGALRVQLLIFLALLFTFLCQVKSNTAESLYDRATLLQLRERSNFGLFDPNVLESFPELARYADPMLSRAPTGGSPDNRRPKRRRGRRGGTDRKLRRLVSNGRITLPIILSANVQSLANKMDELQTRITTEKVIQDCSILCFCENMAGGEHTGRGSNTSRLHALQRGPQRCTERQDPRRRNSRPRQTSLVHRLELQCIIVSVVYIPPSANEEAALKELHDMISGHENTYPDAAVIILGDFNHCNLRKTMPKLHQFVNFPTRENKTLDHCYCNIKNAFSAEPQPHFGKSDHLAIRLKPVYNKRLKSRPLTVRTINTWTDSAQASLQSCLEATDWNTFKEATNDIHEYTETVSDYISWCTSICAPPRTVRMFPNQKPWFNGDIKQKIRKRREAFKSGDQEEYKRARYELQKSIRAAKRAHSQKLEGYYLNHNTRSMWQGIQSVTNYRKTTITTDPRDATLPDSLNNFYARFDRLNTDTPSKTPCNPTDNPLQVTQTQVLKALKKVNPHKAVGPDGVSPRVLKACGEQLAGVYTDIFNSSLSQAVVPRIFKTSTIIPVPKRPDTPTLNDFRPVALTPVAMKCLEKLVLTHINNSVPDTVDPLQFAYRPNRSADDAVALALHHTLQHLDSSRAYARMLFLDYSSAFNTIRPGRLIVKLADLGVPTPTCNWILDFLIERPQVVKMGGRVSAEITVSTGSPQGCCLSPKLFTLYTHDCVSTQDSSSIIIKYADDTTILGLIKGGDESGYRALVNDTVVYGEENDLLLNTDKTKELVLDFRKNPPPLQPLFIRGTEVERADSYRFLGLQVTSDLSWTQNTTATVKKAQQRLYFIRLLRKAGLNHRPLTQAYRGLIESILTAGITVWYGNTTVAERKALQRVIKSAERIIGTKLPSMDSMYEQRCRKRAEGIIRDSLHPAHPLLRHKRCRYNFRHSRADSIKTQRTRFFNSFFPATVRLMANK